MAGVVLAAVAGSLVGVGGSASAAAGTRSARYEDAVVAQVNQARSEKGLAPLRLVPCVDTVAEAAAATLRRTQRPARVRDAFMRRECSRSLELNAVAVGPFRPATLVRSWLADREARGVLLARRVRAIGVGAMFTRGRGWHVSLLVAGRYLGGGAAGSVPDEEAAPTPTPNDTTVTTPDGTTSTVVTAQIAELQAAILEETNRRRESHGLTPLQPSVCAAGFATGHSAWMAEAGELTHADLTELRALCEASAAAENIAVVAGPSLDARAVVQAWMDSPGHRANILDPDLTHLGVGVAHDAVDGRWYATQDFLDAA